VPPYTAYSGTTAAELGSGESHVDLRDKTAHFNNWRVKRNPIPNPEPEYGRREKLVAFRERTNCGNNAAVHRDRLHRKSQIDISGVDRGTLRTNCSKTNTGLSRLLLSPYIYNRLPPFPRGTTVDVEYWNGADKPAELPMPLAMRVEVWVPLGDEVANVGELDPSIMI
jgi:hypothetical protein